MSSAPVRRVSPQEYLTLERRAKSKSEFYNGEIFAVAGDIREHNLVLTNLTREFSPQLKDKPCEVDPNEMRMRIPNGPYVYPEVVVVCSEPQFEDEGMDTLTNPLVVVEVLSDSTADFWRGEQVSLLLASRVAPRVHHGQSGRGTRRALFARTGRWVASSGKQRIIRCTRS